MLVDDRERQKVSMKLECEDLCRMSSQCSPAIYEKKIMFERKVKKQTCEEISEVQSWSFESLLITHMLSSITCSR